MKFITFVPLLHLSLFFHSFISTHFHSFLYQTVAVECQDNGNPSYSIRRNISVRISDVNEAPYDIRLNSSTVVKENVDVGYVIGPLTCRDPDIGQRHLFTVMGNYSSVFQVRTQKELIRIIWKYKILCLI